MKYTGILMSGPMVRAILEGRKTQTRRVMKPQPTTPPRMVGGALLAWVDKNKKMPAHIHGFVCPYGQVGDRLWVRETFALMIPAGASIHAERIPHYRADADTAPRWTPSIHMPRWASRITLEITGVKVERIQDISEEDAMDEGIDRRFFVEQGISIGESDENIPYRRGFHILWDSINAKRGYGWDVNPWDFALTFKVI